MDFSQLREVLGIKEGDLLPSSAFDAEILALQAAIAARVEAIRCCLLKAMHSLRRTSVKRPP